MVEMLREKTRWVTGAIDWFRTDEGGFAILATVTRKGDRFALYEPYYSTPEAVYHGEFETLSMAQDFYEKLRHAGNSPIQGELRIATENSFLEEGYPTPQDIELTQRLSVHAFD